MEYVTLLILGVIVGLLIRDIIVSLRRIERSLKKDLKELILDTKDGETKFFDPMTDKEKWEAAKAVDDLLK